MFYRIGEWVSAETPPENSEATAYALSMSYRDAYEYVSNEVWRYWNDTWQFYENEVFRPLMNPDWKVEGYAVIEEVKPYHTTNETEEKEKNK